MLTVANIIMFSFLSITLGQIVIRTSVDLYFDIKERIENEKTKH